MNPFKKLLNFHLGWFTPAILGGLFEKAFGSDIPRAPSLGQIMPSNAGTSGLLSNTSTSFDPNSRALSSTVTPTGLGQGLINQYSGINDQAQQAYGNFDIGGYADERYALMRNLLNRDDMMGANRLLEAQNAATGGVGVSTGSRQLMGNLAESQQFNRQRAMLGLFNQGEQREGNLFNRQRQSLADYSGLLSGLDNPGRDQALYGSLAGVNQRQAMGQFTDQMNQYDESQAFWNSIGSGFGNSIGGAISGGSLFGSGNNALGTPLLSAGNPAPMITPNAIQAMGTPFNQQMMLQPQYQTPSLFTR